MNYEKKYKEALEKAKKLYGKYCITNVLEYIFPELKESEDERIRKELIEQIAYIIPNDDEVDDEGDALPSYQERINKYRAWLEKQGEQHSPIDINKMVDEFAHTEVKGYGIPIMIEVDAYRKGIEDALEKQGEQKSFPKQLDADKVIEWLKTHGNLVPIVTIRINEVIAKFKEDFGL